MSALSGPPLGFYASLGIDQRVLRRKYLAECFVLVRIPQFDPRQHSDARSRRRNLPRTMWSFLDRRSKIMYLERTLFGRSLRGEKLPDLGAPRFR